MAHRSTRKASVQEDLLGSVKNMLSAVFAGVYEKVEERFPYGYGYEAQELIDDLKEFERELRSILSRSGRV